MSDGVTEWEDAHSYMDNTQDFGFVNCAGCQNLRTRLAEAEQRLNAWREGNSACLARIEELKVKNERLQAVAAAAKALRTNDVYDLTLDRAELWEAFWTALAALEVPDE